MSRDQIAEVIKQAIDQRWSGKRLEDAIDVIAAQVKPPKK